MDHDPELLFNYLNQTRELFGNRIFMDEHDGENAEQNKHDLDSFCQSICHCQKCPLGSTRTNFVFGVGNPQADIVFVGEHELHQPKRVTAAGRLAHRKRETARSELAEINAVAIDHPTAIVGDLDIAMRVGIVLEFGQIFFGNDRARYIPARVDHHMIHLIREFRGASVASVAANDGAGLK